MIGEQISGARDCQGEKIVQAWRRIHVTYIGHTGRDEGRGTRELGKGLKQGIGIG